SVDGDHVAERYLLHAPEGDRGRPTLQVDRALDELRNTVGRRHRHPGDFELGELQQLPDRIRDLCAEVDRESGRPAVAASKGEGAGRLPVAQLDGTGLLDLVECGPHLLTRGGAGQGRQPAREGKEHRKSETLSKTTHG